MGEAIRQRRKLKDRVLTRCPSCIYCGGEVPATTVDHVPPIAIFDLRQRPRGLEFSACGACNSGARLDEQVAAMLSRVYPDPSTEAGKAETRKLMNAVSNNSPGLLPELWPDARQWNLVRQQGNRPPRGNNPLNCSGPLLNRALHRFAAKIGYALHFELTGKPVPADGAASVRWYANAQTLDGELPYRLIEMLGEPQTLRQGSREVGDQFRYASKATEDGAMSAHFASFRFSFGVCAFVAERAEEVLPPHDADHMTIHRPGWLQEAA